jgi:hypothetical protein
MEFKYLREAISRSNQSTIWILPNLAAKLPRTRRICLYAKKQSRGPSRSSVAYPVLLSRRYTFSMTAFTISARFSKFRANASGVSSKRNLWLMIFAMGRPEAIARIAAG